MTASDTYALLTLIWLASALQILSVSDIALDSDRLSEDAGHRTAAQERLAAQGMPVDFSDFASPRHSALPLAAEALDAIEAAAISALATHARPLVIVSLERVEARTNDLAPASARLVQRALDELRRGLNSKAKLASR